MLSKEKRSEIMDYLEKVSPNSDVFIGTDSQIHKSRGTITYATAIVVHINNKNGCKVFVDVSSEKYKNDSIFQRMLMETQKSIEAYEALTPYLQTRHVEIHLDINPSAMHASNKAEAACVGWAKGATGRDVHIKPAAFSFAASCVADAHTR